MAAFSVHRHLHPRRRRRSCPRCSSARASPASRLPSSALAAERLALTSTKLPTGIQCEHRLAVVAGGVVLGFPLLTSYALTTAARKPRRGGDRTAACGDCRRWRRSAGKSVLPLSFWTIGRRSGPSRRWCCAWCTPAVIGRLHWSDLLLFGAVVAAAIGYAEGGMLFARLGSWQTVSWALVLAAPVMTSLTAVSMVQQPPSATRRPVGRARRTSRQ